MTSARIAFICRFLSATLTRASDEIIELRQRLDEQLQRMGRATRPLKRTLYLPDDPLDDL